MNVRGMPIPARELGFVEWFRPGEHERVEQAVAAMKAAGATRLRTHLSWAEYHAPGGEAWYDWLLPRLTRHFELLPCIHYTPPSLSRTGHSSGAPRRLKDYADFVDHVLTRYGSDLRHIELWNEPNNLLDWDWRVDQDWLLFCEMIGNAAHWARHRGFGVVLGAPCPLDPHWFDVMGRRGLLGLMSAVGFHGFPGTWDSEGGTWRGYETHLGEMRTILDRYNPDAAIWITEAGYSTWRGDEQSQVERFAEAARAPADRLYWYGWQDIPKNVAVQEGVYFDPRHYFLGVTDSHGRPKLLRRLLESGGVQAAVPLAAPSIVRPAGHAAVLGGAGFIGSNLADALLQDGRDVVVLDNLSRPGVERNLAWLTSRHPRTAHPCIADIRDAGAVRDAIKGAAEIFHLAGQVAVTSSLLDPMEDFSVNAQGTLTVLEAVRRHAPSAPFVFASTNKVYGNLADLPMERRHGAHLPLDPALRMFGVGETRPLSFCTPYGCSKGVADQYVLDYAHSFGLRTAVLRMSCVYGPRQFGTEDQGWLAHFLKRALLRQKITIFGDGHQVRDVLHVSDAVAAYRGIAAAIDDLGGSAWNLGGGPDNAVSLDAVIREIGLVLGRDCEVAHEDWRSGDQLYFVADTRRLTQAMGWRAQVGWREGVRDLAAWLRADLAGTTADDRESALARA